MRKPKLVECWFPEGMWCFSPLAGIRYAETFEYIECKPYSGVSVPLRGLDMRKPDMGKQHQRNRNVSVPLRGLDMRKQADRVVG